MTEQKDQTEADGVASELTQMLDLKPCPFCGTMNLDYTSNGYENHYVECGECGCSGPPGIDNRDAAAMWNMRGANAR